MAKHPMTRMDDDVERPRPHGDTDTLDNNAKTSSRGYWIAFLFCVPIAACLMVLVWYYGPDARYSVAIDSASALDPNKTGVSFNLTLGVASRSHAATACIHPGMLVEVLYRGVKVAATNATENRPTCAMPRSTAGLPVVARSTGVLVGASVLDNLAAEVRRGAAVSFDLRLQDPYATRWHDGKSWAAWLVSDCKGGRVGGAAVPCDSPTYTEVLI